MSKSNIKSIFEGKISEYLGTNFTLKRYTDNRNGTYTAHGTIIRYDASTNVEVMLETNEYIPRYWTISDDNIIMDTRYIGAISLGKAVCVTDPLYTRDVCCMTTLHNVKPGVWDVHAAIDTIDSRGELTYVLELRHRDEKETIDISWVEHFRLGVDSAAMSVIDDAYYCRKDGSVEAYESDPEAKEAFHEECFRLKDEYAGIYHAEKKAVGVICSSGNGDGMYPLYIAEKENEVIAIRISFM